VTPDPLPLANALAPTAVESLLVLTPEPAKAPNPVFPLPELRLLSAE
jgi:hypothetical protein